ncbi:hypothetical protein BOX15_Mlig021711g1, partial [Macrostomum lignano]
CLPGPMSDSWRHRQQQLAGRLQSAVLAGDEAEAGQIVEQLCSGPAAGVRVYPDPDNGSLASSIEAVQLVSIVLQTRCARVSQPLHLAMPTVVDSVPVTIADLKRELLLRFDIPTRLQTCIVGQEIPPDEAPLNGLAAESETLAGCTSRLPASRLLVRVYVRAVGDWRPPPAELRSLKEAVCDAKGNCNRFELVNPVQSCPPPPSDSSPPGWDCPTCTFRNKPSRLGCEICSGEPPPGYEPVVEAEDEARRLQLEREFLEQQERQRSRNLSAHLALANCSLIPAKQDFECPICITDVSAECDADGIQLRDCGHEVCRECLRQHLLHADSMPVRCPHDQCQQTVTDSEANQLLTSQEFDRLQRLGLRQAEAVIPNTFHCVAPNCDAFVELAEDVNSFECMLCGLHNCVTCRASHPGVSCRRYQNQLRIDAKNNKEAQLNLTHLEKMVKSGEAMNCPNCQVFLQKKEGCDWLACSMCQTEICWATRGPRWGPGGKGDTSGGCKCRLNGRLCHPECQNCH